jgi:uncharacterized cupredoxin-like copper-binding protein
MHMKINPKISLGLVGGIILLVTLACGASLGGANDSPVVAPITDDVEETRAGTTIEVKLSEFEVSLEPTQTVAGEVIFNVRNEGHLPHDFKIWGSDVDYTTSMLQPGESETFTVSLEPGSYDYECTVEGHNMLGMRGSIVVLE